MIMPFAYKPWLTDKNDMIGGQPPNRDNFRNVEALEIDFEVNCVAFHPILPIVAIGSSDRRVKLWRLNDNGTLAQHTPIAILIGHTQSIKCVAFHPHLHIIATTSTDRTAKLWRLNDNGTLAQETPIANLIWHNNVIYSIAFHPLLNIVATGSRDGTAMIWRLNDGGALAQQTPVATLVVHDTAVYCVAFHPQLPILATGSADGTANFWRLNDNGTLAQETSIHTFTGHIADVRTVAFHSSLPIFATGSLDHSVKLWRLNHDGTLAQQTPVATLVGHESAVNSVAFHPHFPIVVNGNDFVVNGNDYGTVNVWQLNDNGTLALPTPIATLTDHNGDVKTVAFHSSLPILATGSYDTTINLWHTNIVEPHHLKIFTTETDIPENVRSAPCALCNLPICAQIPDTTYNINGYVVKLSLVHHFHYNCIHRYLTNRQSISQPIPCPSCDSVIDSDEISRFLNSPDADADTDAKLGTGFYRHLRRPIDV